MLKRFTFVLTVGLAGATACGQAKFNPEDPAVLATIDSIVEVAVQGAAAVDADKVLSIAEGPGEFTFITGDIMMSGFEPIKAQFKKTYSHLKSQTHAITEKRVRLLSPDVALVTAVGEGTYTDNAGWTSPPVGIGTSIIFVRENGRWRATHVHQSIAP